MSGLHPIPPLALSRRGLLGAFGVAAGAVAVGSGTAAVAAASRNAEPLRRSAWTSLVGSTLPLNDGGSRTQAQVVRIEELGLPDSPVRKACAGREDAFAVVFAVPGPLTAVDVRVEHPSHGTIPLFLTGGARVDGSSRYVASIDRRSAA